MNDKQIVDLLFQKNEDGLINLEQKFKAYCSSIAWNLLGNQEDTEECLNDTWFKTWHLIPPNRPESLQAFVAKITRGTAIDKLKTKYAAKRPDSHLTELEQEVNELSTVWNSVEKEIEQKEITALLNQFLENLSTKDRDMFLRRYWFADTLSEIAVRHQTTIGSVRGNLYRNRNKLREFLRKNEVDV